MCVFDTACACSMSFNHTGSHAGIDVQHTINASQLFFSAPNEGTVYTTGYDGSLPVRVWNASAGESPVAVAVDASVNLLFVAVSVNSSSASASYVVCAFCRNTCTEHVVLKFKSLCILLLAQGYKAFRFVLKCSVINNFQGGSTAVVDADGTIIT